MLKAVVFDDEYIVLQGLRSMINWRQYGIELAGTAGDGVLALRLFRELRPDIVLTDIRMPGMDGLQLIEILTAEAPETMFIVFSGFNEFDCVRRAIGLGVVDYLEKPVTIPKIEEAMRKAIDRIVRQQAFSAMKAKWESSDALWERLIQISADAAGVFGTGGTYASLSETSRSYKEGRRALRYGRFLGESGWTRIEDVGENDTLPDGLTKHEEAVIYCLRTGDREGLFRALGSFESWMESQRLNPEKAEREILKLVYLGLEVAKETGRDIGEFRWIPHQELSTMHTREAMFGWLRSRLADIGAWM
ncbi:response regulator, partial [Paenibacillus darwinianus]